MSRSETTVSKTHATGTWRAIRSMAVPASVIAAHSGESEATQQPGIRKVRKIEEESVRHTGRKFPGYFETADPSFSKS